MSTETVESITSRPAVWPAWTFGDRIRKIRRLAGMTQQEFAQAVRVSKGSLQNWEAEQSRPSYQTLMTVAMMCEHKFGVAVDWTIADDERSTDDSRAFARSVGEQMRWLGSAESTWLPRLDSNQQPSGYRYRLITRRLFGGGRPAGQLAGAGTTSVVRSGQFGLDRDGLVLAA